MISISHISKAFPGVQALDDVSFDIQTGKVHGIVGENGAGKSTLIKILSGIYTEYQGEIIIDGEPVRFSSVHDAQNKGVTTIFQELTIVKGLSIAENIFLGREPAKTFGALNWEYMYDKSKEVMASLLEDSLDPRKKVENLSVASQQLIEICKAQMLKAKIMIMDEPTSSLTSNEVVNLFKLIHKLRNQGMTILYVSHKIEEIFEICDSITVFRDGRHIDTMEKDHTNSNEVISKMVGRSMDMLYPPRAVTKKDEKVLSVDNISRKDEYEEVSFDLYRGEIVGFAGLIGAGRTEVVKTLFGATQPDSGSFILNGKTIHSFLHPHYALSRGIAYLSEDRKGEGLMLDLSIRENMTISVLKKLSNWIFVDERKVTQRVEEFRKKLKIKMVDEDQSIENISGGNQQKVVVARLLLTEADIFIFDEPTRGIDVGAKYEIYKIMDDLTKAGKGIIFISSELPEVIGVSDRILCMREGKLVEEFTREDAHPEAIMKVLTGGEAS